MSKRIRVTMLAKPRIERIARMLVKVLEVLVSFGFYIFLGGD